MNRQLASAVLGTFRTFDPPEHAHRLGRFRQRQWQQTLHWLDASGLALYFLRELRIQGIEHVVPSPILEQLGRRQRDNIERTKSLFEEFAKINAAFRAAGFQYLNLKGFTLAPDYCPDLSLRYQTDCDFLMHESDAVRCQDILEQFGYGIVAANASVFEFKTDVGTTPGIADLYKPRVERSVEVHLCDVSRPDRHPELLIRARELPVDGDAYPALSTGDMFLSQAYHLFRHLRSEWTRISWVLELKHFVARHRDDEALWRTVRTRAGQYRDGALAVELALHFGEAVLGHFAPEDSALRSIVALPSETATWVDRYANEIALTDFPGSKLYLILEETLGANESPSNIRSRLFPTHGPAPIVVAPAKGLVQWVRGFVCRAAYFTFRLRFHLRSTAQYFVEHWLWTRQRKSSPIRDRSCSPVRYTRTTTD